MLTVHDESLIKSEELKYNSLALPLVFNTKSGIVRFLINHYI
jgi:hypothetical protein